jgi:hypothetical protein
MSPLTSLAFRPNVQEKATEKAIVVFDSVIYVIAFILVAICAYEIVPLVLLLE